MFEYFDWYVVFFSTPSFGTEDLKLTSKTLTTLEHILFILMKLMDEGSNFASDYRVVLSRTSVMAYTINQVKIVRKCHTGQGHPYFLVRRKRVSLPLEIDREGLG